MGIDKIKKKKKKRKIYFSGKRVGFEPGGMAGSDGRGGDGGSSSSSSDDGDNDNNYSAPAPSYSVQDDIEDFATNVGSTASVDGGFEDDSSGDDFEEDVVNVMEELGIKDTFNSPTVDVSTITGEDGLGEGDYDDGRSLYTSNTQTTKENQPYVNYTPGPNAVTAQELYNLNRGLGDNDQQAATLANIQAINPIEKQEFFDSGIGKGLKTAAKFALPFVAAPIAGLAFGQRGYQLANLGMKGKRAYDFAKRVAPNMTTALTRDFRPGSGGKPPAATGFDDNDSGSNIIPKNVIASNIEKYNPTQVNSLQKNISLLESVLDRGSYQNTRLNNSQLAQVSNQRDSLVQEYNRIQEFLV